MSSSPNATSIPLLFDGDGYCIDVVDNPGPVLLLRVLLTPNNENVESYEVKWFDLSPDAREAILRQVRRRFEGRSVKV